MAPPWRPISAAVLPAATRLIILAATRLSVLPLTRLSVLPLTLLSVLALTLLSVGCEKPTQAFSDKAPRPVTIQTLLKKNPTTSFMVSGAVKSWKTEQIGFEVGGRVQWVREPGQDITGRILDPDGVLLSEGTPLAQIDPARYQVAVETAKADLEVTQLSREEIQIQVSEAIPADTQSATADLSLAEDEFLRVQGLFRQNAASQSERDQAQNLVQKATARIAVLTATENQAKATLKSADARIKRAQQALQDAQRDLEHTTLYASYQGQISDVQVVPGSVVAAGAPVLTLQMMTPIKVEVELSAKQSRVIARRRLVPVSFRLPTGEPREQNALVYAVAPSADLSTRTFTLTLLILNEKLPGPIPDGVDAKSIARAKDAWPLSLNRMMGAPTDRYMVEERSLIKGPSGDYVYVITNAKMGDPLPVPLHVKRQAVELQNLRIPFLGNWIFRAVTFVNSTEVDAETMVVADLEVPQGDLADWQGDAVILDPGPQWMLRPGDLVSVNLSGDDTTKGFYVPDNAIYEQSGTTCLFVLEQKDAGHSLVRRLQVATILPETLDNGSEVQVESPQLHDGMQFVVGGVHYLNDGDRVNPLAQIDPKP